MLDERRRDDIMWLVNTYDELIGKPVSPARDADLATVQKWLCRVTGMSTISGATDAARRLTRHNVSFIARDASQDLSRAPLKPGDQNAKPASAPIGRKVAPAFDDNKAATVEKLLAELNSLRGRSPTTREKAKTQQLRRKILELTGFSTLDGVRQALRTFLKRRDGKRKFVPTKTYARYDAPRSPRPRVTFVQGGSPGSGRRR